MTAVERAGHGAREVARLVVALNDRLDDDGRVMLWDLVDALAEDHNPTALGPFNGT